MNGAIAAHTTIFLRYIRKRRKKGLLGIYFTFEYFSLFLILPTKKFNEGKKNSKRTFPLYQACRKAELFKNPPFFPFFLSDPISLKNLESKLVTYFLKPVTMEKKSGERLTESRGP